jgi:phosphoribosylglycinamide formyltransferase-1
MTRTRIAVLASGGGSNLQAILDYFDCLGSARAGDVVMVASDREDAGALARAEQRGIPTAVLATPKRPSGVPLERLLDAHTVDLVVLAGYLRLVPSEVVRGFAGRIVNVHPGPLPEFGGAGMYGPRVHQAVLDAGLTTTAVSIHLVNDEYDRGPVIARWPVPVVPGDDAASLAARVLQVEHVLYPRVVDALATLTSLP